VFYPVLCLFSGTGLITTCSSQPHIVPIDHDGHIWSGSYAQGAPLSAQQITEVQCTVLRLVYAGSSVERRT